MKEAVSKCPIRIRKNITKMVNLYKANQRKGINMVRKPVRKLRNA